MIARHEQAVKDGVAPAAIRDRVSNLPGGSIVRYEDIVEPPAPQPSVTQGWKSSELYVATIIPIIGGIAVSKGWLTEDTVKSLGIDLGGAYVIGRSLLKIVQQIMHAVKK